MAGFAKLSPPPAPDTWGPAGTGWVPRAFPWLTDIGKSCLLFWSLPALPSPYCSRSGAQLPQLFFFLRGLPESWFSLAPIPELSYPPPKPDAAGFVDLRSALDLYHRGSGRPAAPPLLPPQDLLSSLSRNLSQFPSQNLQKGCPNYQTTENPQGLKASRVCPYTALSIQIKQVKVPLPHIIRIIASNLHLALCLDNWRLMAVAPNPFLWAVPSSEPPQTSRVQTMTFLPVQNRTRRKAFGNGYLIGPERHNRDQEQLMNISSVPITENRL